MNNYLQSPIGGSTNTASGKLFGGRRVSGNRYWIILLVFLSQSISALGQDDFVIDAATAEAWVFQNHGDRQQAEKAVASQLEISISQVKRKFTLSPPQEESLRLAASGDIKRFFDSADLVIKKIAGLKVGQNQFNDAWQLTIPIQQRMRKGLFADNSLFQKVLYTTLEPAQSAALIESEKVTLARKLKAYVNAAIANLEFSIPFTSSQRDQLGALLLDSLKGMSVDHQYVQYLIFLKLTQIDENVLASFLDPQQIKGLQKFDQSLESIEAFLQQQGIIETKGQDE